MSRNKSAEAYSCGEPGDLYSWNATSWELDKHPYFFYDKSNSTPTITKQIKQLVCANKEFLKIPRNSLHDSQKNCTAMTGGNLLQGDHAEFPEIIKQSGLNVCWLPYTDEEEEGSFKNTYSNDAFNVSLFTPGYPKGGKKNNLIMWYREGAIDVPESDAWKASGLCEEAIPLRSYKLRGLCSSSLIDKVYRPTMHPDGKTIVWIGSGRNKAIIQFSNKVNELVFKSLQTGVYAQFNFNYNYDPFKSSIELIGKHKWTIFNDTGCSEDVHYYVSNVSFR